MLLHPNPANNSIVLNAVDASCHMIQIHHVSGALAKEWNGLSVPTSGSVKLDISDLASGIYIVSGHSAANKQSARLIVR